MLMLKISNKEVKLLATNSIHFMKFYLDEELSIEDLHKKIFNSESENEDKFILNDYTDFIIDGYYIYYYNSKEIIYNEYTSSLEETIIKKNTIIPFSIDVENNILDIWSNNINVNRLVLKIGIMLNHKVKIDLIQIDLEKILVKLNKNNNIKVGNVKIENYLLENDIVANCNFDLKNHNNPLDILKKYLKNLVKVTLMILDGEENITMIIYKSGSVVVYKARQEISLETLDLIRDICIR
jgi:hypothetical protein